MARTRAGYDKEQVIADWKSGRYKSLRDLAHKHKVSHQTIHTIIKGIDRSLEPLIDKFIEVKQELANLNITEIDTVYREVDNRLKHLDLITNATHLNINRMMAKFKDKDAEFPVMEHKLIQSTIKDARESLLGKEQAPAVINQTITMPKEEISERINRLNELTRVVQG